MREESTTAEAGGPAPAPHHADVALFALVVIWGVNFSVIKLGLAHVEPFAFNALRFPLAGAVVYLLLRRRGPIPLPEPRDRLRVVLLGLLGNVFYQGLFILGLNHTRAGNASLLLAGSPIMIALLSAAVGHERVGRQVAAAVVLTVAGMVLVVLGGRADVAIGSATLLGDVLMISAAVMWAVYTVGARSMIERYGSVAVTAWTLWSSLPVLLALGAPELARTDFTEVPAGAWAAVAYAGILGIGVAYLLWYHGVRSIGNTRTGTYSNLVPVVALFVAWLWLGEVPTAWQLAGAAVIIGGVTLARRKRSIRRPAQP